MKKIFDRIACFAAKQPELAALSDDTGMISYRDLHPQPQRVADELTGPCPMPASVSPRTARSWWAGISLADISANRRETRRNGRAAISDFATAHGRNVAPEWIETELTADPAIAQAAVFGEGRRFNVAVVVPSHAAAVMKIGRAIARVNKTLPDDARASRWIIAEEAFTPRNGLANVAGAIDRDAIATKYALPIERLYEREISDAIL